MDEAIDNIGWRQHYPTYRFKDSVVALEEYKFATKTLEAEERVFLNAANLSVIIGATLGSLALGSLDNLIRTFSPVIPGILILGLILILTAGFSILSLRYFADRQKAVVFAARKVIVLRRMLGMSYGSFQLVLPNWRIEGADEPFAIRLFPGWNTYVSYPCYAISGIASALVFFVLAAFFKQLNIDDVPFTIKSVYFITGISALWFVVLSLVYRVALVDVHERRGLIFTQWLAQKVNLKLVSNIEYVIYRANLARYELKRLEIDLTNAKKFLVHIEDKEFYSHPGISFKGIARLIFSVLGARPRSGGSTITQQLVRTLFIHDQSKLVRRKLIEIMLALWFNKIFTKNDQLELYLASVRFESNVYGLVSAMTHYFGDKTKMISPAEAFFLIERVSNIKSRLLDKKIIQTLNGAIDVGIIDNTDLVNILDLYQKSIESGKIQDSKGVGIDRLKVAMTLSGSE